jgi:phospholipase C
MAATYRQAMRQRNLMRLPALAMACSSLLAAGLAACTSSSSSPARPEHVSGGPTGTYLVASGIHKIKHVIIVMQENRSFDSYFGTFPGADGIPMTNGQPAVCVPNPAGDAPGRITTPPT